MELAIALFRFLQYVFLEIRFLYLIRHHLHDLVIFYDSTLRAERSDFREKTAFFDEIDFKTAFPISTESINL